MHETVATLRRELRVHDKPENKVNIQRFFKEKLKNPYALRGPVFKKISAHCFATLASRPKKEILRVCDEVIETDLAQSSPQPIGQQHLFLR